MWLVASLLLLHIQDNRGYKCQYEVYDIAVVGCDIRNHEEICCLIESGRDWVIYKPNEVNPCCRYSGFHKSHSVPCKIGIVFCKSPGKLLCCGVPRLMLFQLLPMAVLLISLVTAISHNERTTKQPSIQTEAHSQILSGVQCWFNFYWPHHLGWIGILCRD